jgi:hypothetical protein
MRRSSLATKRCSSISSGSSRKNWRTVQPKKNWMRCSVSLSLFRQYHPRAHQVGLRLCLSRHLIHSASQPSLRVASVNTCLNYECQEILDYPSVYYIGTGSEKKRAHPDRTTNNYGYDDERGDYLVVDHDHLAYRYEVMDSLGKGSFGQVLSCRDHATGSSVAIKIIRNKKRFHHQALVEIKILDNLRQWVYIVFFVRVPAISNPLFRTRRRSIMLSR